MSLDFYTPPDIDEIISRVKTYIKSELKQLNPTDQNSVIYSLVVAMANLSNDNNKQILTDILPNIFPQYCKTETALENHAYLRNVSRRQASQSSGTAVIQGNTGLSVPAGTTFIANSISYRVKNTADIIDKTLSISEIAINGTLATVTTASSHNLASGISTTIAGAESEELNGTFIITVINETQFTYSISQSLVTTETTSGMTATVRVATLTLNSVETGANTNLKNGDTLDISDNIEGISSTAQVTYGGISGGEDIESFDSWQSNIISKYRNPITQFNANNIEATLKAIEGITKVWVKPCTPAIGQVTVYFIMGADEDVIPSSTMIERATEAVTALRTVKDDPSDVFVYAPTPKKIDFTFSSITPDTNAMRQAIKNSLTQLFSDEIELGETLTALTYNNAIGNSYDTTTGKKITAYTLTSPTEDVTVESNELPTLGDVNFA